MIFRSAGTSPRGLIVPYRAD